MREPIGARIERPVGQPLLPAQEGQRLGRARHLRLKKRGQGRLGQRVGRGIELLEQGVPLLRPQNLQPVQRHLRPPHPRLEHAYQAAHQGLGGAALEALHAVLELALQPQGRAACP